MKVLFSTSSFGLLRNFQSSIRLLAEHGHEIRLLAERSDTVDGQKMADALVSEPPSITAGFIPSCRHRLWYTLGTDVRASLDYWRLGCILNPRMIEAGDMPGVNLSFSTQNTAPLPTKGRGLDHIGFEVADLDGFVASLAAKEIKIEAPVRQVPNSRSRSRS